MIDIQLTTTNYNKGRVQFQVYGNKIYYIWEEADSGGMGQLWTGISNLDGSGFSATKRTDISNTASYGSNLQVVDNLIYCVWQMWRSGVGGRVCVATMNLDQSGFTVIRNDLISGDFIQFLQFQVVGDKIYFVWLELGTNSKYQIQTAVMDTDGTDWSDTERTATSYNKVLGLDFQVVGNNIYYIYIEADAGAETQIWTATMTITGTGWATTKQTTSGLHTNPRLSVSGSYIYYVYNKFITDYQIGTARSDLNGSNWSATVRTDFILEAIKPQFQIVDSKIYYTFVVKESTSVYQLYIASMETDGTNWAESIITTRESNKRTPQLQVVSGEIYWVWSEQINAYWQIWLGGDLTSHYEEPYEEPTITTVDNACKDRQSTTLTATGNVTVTGGGVTYRGFEFYEIGTGEYLDSMYAVREIGVFPSTGEFEMTLSGLKPLTCYWIRAFAGNIFGIGFGGWVICCTTEVPSYDVYEEEGTPTICFYVSEDVGHTWSLKFGPYTTDQADIAITKILVRGSGKKQIKFTTDALTGLSASVMCKVDVKI